MAVLIKVTYLDIGDTTYLDYIPVEEQDDDCFRIAIETMEKSFGHPPRVVNAQMGRYRSEQAREEVQKYVKENFVYKCTVSELASYDNRTDIAVVSDA